MRLHRPNESAIPCPCAYTIRNSQTSFCCSFLFCMNGSFLVTALFSESTSLYLFSVCQLHEHAISLFFSTMDIDKAHGQNYADWNQSDIWEQKKKKKRNTWMSDFAQLKKWLLLFDILEPIMSSKICFLFLLLASHFYLHTCLHIQVYLKWSLWDNVSSGDTWLWLDVGHYKEIKSYSLLSRLG